MIKRNSGFSGFYVRNKFMMDVSTIAFYSHSNHLIDLFELWAIMFFGILAFLFYCSVLISSYLVMGYCTVVYCKFKRSENAKPSIFVRCVYLKCETGAYLKCSIVSFQDSVHSTEYCYWPSFLVLVLFWLNTNFEFFD